MRRLPTPHLAPGRGGAEIRRIVVHTTVGTALGTADWFARPESGVSAHYLVGLDGRVAQFVDDADTAFHCGVVVEPTAPLEPGEDPNRTSLGIEFEDGGEPRRERPAALYDAGGALLARLAERHGLALDRGHVVAHRELRANSSCPGTLDLERLLLVARSIHVALAPQSSTST